MQIGKLHPLELSEDFKYALNAMEHTSDHLFVTGKAGTGKSTLLHLFKKTTRKRTVVLAPTGLAALNIKGQTIHSFFGFPPKFLSSQDITKRRNHKMFKRVDVIIIDEISMVRADMIDNIDRFLRINRNKNIPFGGAQMFFFGDLFQLPPIISTAFERQQIHAKYETPYFFSALVFQNEAAFEIVFLNKIYRQEERHFIRLLDSIRSMYFDYEDLETLNERYTEEDDPDDGFYVTLSPRLDTVNAINYDRINALTSPPQSYNAIIKGQFNAQYYPTQAQLTLKEGAQVIFIKNDPDKAFVNGTIGKITRLHREQIDVEVENKNGSTSTIEVSPLDWEIRKYRLNEGTSEVESDIVGTFTQYPLKLAWAITIHKSQGQTFEKVIIDMGKGAFAFGQSYVALSRCKTLNGIVLKKPFKPNDIRVDPRIIDFYESFR